MFVFDSHRPLDLENTRGDNRDVLVLRDEREGEETFPEPDSDYGDSSDGSDSDESDSEDDDSDSKDDDEEEDADEENESGDKNAGAGRENERAGAAAAAGEGRRTSRGKKVIKVGETQEERGRARGSTRRARVPANAPPSTTTEAAREGRVLLPRVVLRPRRGALDVRHRARHAQGRVG